MGEGRNVYRVLMGKPEGKRPLERPRCRWEDGLKIDLREIGGGCVEWIHLAGDGDRWRAVVSMVMNLRDWRHRVSHLESKQYSLFLIIECHSVTSV
jgi:hypothetical protein